MSEQLVAVLDLNGSLTGDWVRWSPTVSQARLFGGRVPSFILPSPVAGGPAALLVPDLAGTARFSAGPLAGQRFLAYLAREDEGAWDD